MLARVLHKSQHPDDTMTRLSYLPENQGDDTSSQIIYHRYHIEGLFIYSADGIAPSFIV